MATRGVDYQIFLKGPPIEDSIFDASPPLASGNGIPRDWICRSKNLLVDVETTNYFKDMAFEFNFMDRVDLRCDNGDYELYVVSSYPGLFPVNLTKVFPSGSPPDPDPIAANTVLGNPTAATAPAVACPLGTNLSYGPDGKLNATAAEPENIAAISLLGNPTAAAAPGVACLLGSNLYFSPDGKINAIDTPPPDQLTWAIVTNTSNVAMEPNKGYYFTGSYVGNSTLPTTMLRGQMIKVICQVDTGLSSSIKHFQNTGQYIISGNESTTVGSSGNLECVYLGASYTLLCIEDNVKFQLTDIGLSYFGSLAAGITSFNFT